MSGDKALGLFSGLEPPHPSLPNPSLFVALLSTIIGILIRQMDQFRHYCSVGYRITAQLISHDLPGLTAMFSLQAPGVH